MLNEFHLMGRVNVLSEDNPDYPGIYLRVGTTLDFVPVSFSNDLKYSLNLLGNGDLVGVKGRIVIKDTNIFLVADRIVIISKATGGK